MKTIKTENSFGKEIELTKEQLEMTKEQNKKDKKQLVL